MSALRDAAERALKEGHPEQAWDIAAAAREADSPRTRLYAAVLLRELAAKVPEAAWTEPRGKLARHLGIHRPAELESVGEMVFPAVDARGGGRFVRAAVRLIPGDTDVLPVEHLRLRAALDAARALIGDPTQRFDVNFNDLSWEGSSAGLAVGLAACSAARHMALSPMLAATGSLDADGRVGAVGFIPQKLQLRHLARPRCRLIVPRADAAQHPGVLPAASLREALELAGLRPVEDVAEALDHLRKLDRQGDWSGAAREAAKLENHPELTDEERLELLLLRLLAANHSADRSQQTELAPRLDALLGQADIPELLARAIGSLAVTRLDALKPDGARQALALAEGRAWPKPLRVHLDGPRALLATLEGRHEAALALRRDNLQHATTDERARCMGDLADALLRLHRPEEALGWADEALAHADQVQRRRGYQTMTTRYLRLHRARALAALGRRDEAVAALEPLRAASGLDPRIRAALLLVELEDDRAGLNALVDALPDYHRSNLLITALLDRSRARLGDAEAAARLCALPAFRGLDWEEAARRLPY